MEEINLVELLKYFKKNVLLIVIFVGVSLAAMIVYLSFFKEDLYKSSTTIILASEDSEDGITSSDVNLNQSLVGTYSEIIKSKKVLNKVIENLDLDYSYSELVGMINVSNVMDTEVLKIEVTDRRSKSAMVIANEITDVFSDEIVDIYSIDNVSVVDEAEKSSVPCNANAASQLVLSVLVGIILSSGILFILFYFDKKVKTKEDIERITGLPVLGLIPLVKEDE